MRELDGWRLIVRDEREMVKAVRRYQRTMRLLNQAPTWTNFTQTVVFPQAQANLDATMLRKFRAWWQIVEMCGDERYERAREDLKYAWTFLLGEVARKNHGRSLPIDWKPFGMTQERAGLLRDTVKSLYQDLTLS